MLEWDKFVIDGLIDLSPANEWDCGRIWAINGDPGRITVIGHSDSGDDPFNPRESYDSYVVVYHRYWGVLGNTDESIAEFADKDIAIAFAKDFAKRLNKFGDREVG